MKNFLRAAGIFEKNNNRSGAAALYNNMAIICKKQHSLDEAMMYYKKALDINEQLADTQAVSSNMHNIGAVLNESGKYEEALSWLEKALALRNPETDKSGRAQTLQAIAAVYLNTEKPDKALSYNTRAYELYRETGDLHGEAECLNKAGILFFDRHEPEKAQQYFERSLKIGRDLGSLPLQQFALQWLKEVYISGGRTDLALKSFAQYKILSDSMLNEEKSHEITKLREDYEHEKLNQQKQLTILSYKNKLQESTLMKNRLIIISLVLVIVLIAGIAVLIIRRQKTRSQRKIFTLELDKLRQQINPHFIFNSLNSLQSYLFRGDKATSYACLTKLARLMRLILENSQQHTVRIQDEINCLSLYIELMGMRFKNMIEYEVRVDENIDTFQYRIPSLLLQPYIENSICHGLQGLKRTGMIIIEFSLAGEHIHCTIEDNGIGREKASELRQRYSEYEFRSLGTKITEERLKLINTFYGKNLGIKFTDLTDERNNPRGTRVDFDFPILMN